MTLNPPVDACPVGLIRTAPSVFVSPEVRLRDLQDQQTWLSALLSPYEPAAIDRWKAVTSELVALRRLLRRQEVPR